MVTYSSLSLCFCTPYFTIQQTLPKGGEYVGGRVPVGCMYGNTVVTYVNISVI